MRYRPTLPGLTLLALGGCSVPPTSPPADAAAVDAATVDAAKADAATVDVGAAAPDDVVEQPPQAFVYRPAGCAHRVTAQAGTTDHYLDDRSTFGAMPAPRNVHVSWPGDPSTVAAFVWSTDVGTRATVVQYGTSPDALDRVATGAVSSGGFAGNRVTAHEVHVCGLSPDTTWYYRVGGEGHWSAVQRFKTAPAPGRADYDVNFIVTGDSRDGASIWGQVQQRAVSGATPPDFELFSGDAVEVGLFQNLWEPWFEGARPAMSVMPFVAVHGNHEGLSLNYLLQFAQPQSDDPSQDEVTFSFDYGPMHFVVLNDTPRGGEFDDQVMGAELAWMRDDLTRARANRSRVPFIIACHHKPAFASTSHVPDSDARALRATWGPVYDEFGVDLVLNGHEHDFELSKEIDGQGREVNGRRGTRYIVAAGAGAPLNNLGSRPAEPFSAYFESVVNYLQVHATMTRLEITPRRLDGTIIEGGRLTLTPRP